ncbi:MAG TPA: hypothetical protein VH620_03215 [Gaiella sp.]|jgi:hypothetical protein
MRAGKLLRIGGYVSGGVLIAFGIVVIVLGVWGISFTRDHLEQEGIVFGPASDPAVAEHAEQWAGEQVKTGSQALAFANVMREHTLESTGGLTYAEMGRFQSAADPTDPKGTNDEAAAAKDENGQPISNGARDIWVTETALTTALNMGFMSEMLSVFSIVVGVALLLTGIGFVILAIAVFGRARPAEATIAPAPAPVPGAAAG